MNGMHSIFIHFEIESIRPVADLSSFVLLLLSVSAFSTDILVIKVEGAWNGRADA